MRLCDNLWRNCVSLYKIVWGFMTEHFIRLSDALWLSCVTPNGIVWRFMMELHHVFWWNCVTLNEIVWCFTSELRHAFWRNCVVTPVRFWWTKLSWKYKQVNFILFVLVCKPWPKQSQRSWSMRCCCKSKSPAIPASREGSRTKTFSAIYEWGKYFKIEKYYSI